MFEAQTEQVIRQRMLDRISSTIDKLEGSLTYDAVAPVAVELTQMYIELDRILTMVFAQTASGEYLEKRAAEFGVYRKTGDKASGIVRFTGNDGVNIPAGTLCRTAGGLTYITKTVGVIAASIADIPVEASSIGTMFNVPVGAINGTVVQIIGVTSVTNPTAFTNGTDPEPDSLLLNRLLAKAQTPATSGNSNQFKLWALEVEGVGDAKVFDLWNGNGTVKVVVINPDRLPVSAAIVTSVSEHIEAVRPIGATVTVVAAGALSIDISVTVTRDTAYSVLQVTNNITSKVTQYLKTIAFKGSYVSYAQIGNAIIDSEGVIDYSGLTVNGGIANVVIGAGTGAGAWDGDSIMSKSGALKKYVPEFISESIVFQDIYNSQGEELDTMEATINEVLNQCFIDTATWGLKHWERFLGIPVDEGRETAYRRSVIKSKIRGVGTVTVDLIKTVAESYDNGEVDIIEHNDNYSFEVKFVGTKGIPPNLDDLMSAINEIKPAHLGVTYTFQYNTYDHLKGFTHAQLHAHTHKQLREEI